MADTFVADISNFQPSADLPTYRQTNAKIICQISWGTDVTVNAGRIAEIRSLDFTVVLWYMGLVANEDIGAQVGAFVSQIGHLLPGEGVFLDWEATGSTPPPTSQQRDVAESMLASRLGISVQWIGTYGPASLLENSPKPAGWLFPASYETTEPAIPHALWQFTNGQYHSIPYGPIDFPGIGYCDASVFHGSDAELEALVCPPAAKPIPKAPPSSKSVLGYMGVLHQGQKLVSPNGMFEAVLQRDGNFVVYRVRRFTKKAIWATGTAKATAAAIVSLNRDGSVTLYGARSQEVWTNGSASFYPTFLAMQDDGNLVLYTSENVPLWASRGIS